MRLSSFNKIISGLLVFSLSFGAPFLSLAQAAQTTQGAYATEQGGDLWIPWIQAGGKLGDDRAIAATEALLPLYQTRDGMWFADVHYKDIDGSAWESNFGGGYRHLFRDAALPYILGINGFWDHTNSDRSNTFNQGGVGIEFLTAELDFRANGYFPESKTYLISETYTDVNAFVSGNTIATTSKRNEIREDALPGFDVEAGVKIPGLPALHELRVYGGYFYFDEDDAPTIDGPKARVEWRINDVFNIPGSRITLEGSYQDDDVRNDEWFGGITFRIPLDFFGRKYNNSQTPIEKRMMEGIVRDLDIVAADSTSVEALSGPAINPFTGRPYSNIYWAEESGDGPGTQTDPDTLNGAVASAGVDGVVAALSTGGTINESTTLVNGMVLIGGGGALPVQTLEGASGFLTIPGGGPATINDGASGFTITLGDENIISDVTLTGIGDGISGNVILSPWIRNVTADSLGGDGIELDDMTGNLLIENSSFDDNGDDGLDISTVAGNVTIRNTTADDNSSDGMDLDGVTGNVLVDPSSFSGNGSRGLDIQTVTGNIDILDITADDNSSTNLYIDQGGIEGDVSIKSSSFSDSVNGSGIEIYNVFGNTTIADVTAGGNDNENLEIDQDGYEGNVTIASSSFNGSEDTYGIRILNVNGDTTLTNVTADDNQNSNLYIDQDGYTGNLTIDPSSFSDSVSGYGLEIYNVFGNTTVADVTADDNDQTNLYIDQDGFEGDVTIKSSSFSDSVDSYGLEIINVNGNTTITDVTADDNDEINLYIGQNGYEGDVTIKSSSFSGSVDSFGMDILDVNGNITITDVTADDNSDTNLVIDNIDGDVAIDPSSFSGSLNGRGVEITGIDGSVTLRDVTADDNNNRNIVIDGVSGDVLFDNVSGDDSVNARGVGIDGVNGDVTILNSNFNGNQGTNIAIGRDDSIGGNVVIRNTVANDSENFRGIDINDVALGVTLQNVTASGNFGNNLEISDVGGDVSIDPSFFSGSVNGSGISIETVTGNLTLRDVTANGNGDTGLAVEAVGGNVLVQDSSFDSNTDDGMAFDGAIGGNLTLTNVSSGDNGGTGLDIDGSVGGDVFIDPSSFSSNGDLGININDVTGNVTLKDVTADGNDSDNLIINNVGGNVSIDPSSFSGSVSGIGMNISSVVGTVTLDDVTADSNFNHGFLTNTTGVLLIRDSSFSSNGNDGVNITGINSTLQNNTINDNTDDGIELNGTLTVGGSNNTVTGNGDDCETTGATVTGSIGLTGGGSCPEL